MSVCKLYAFNRQPRSAVQLHAFQSTTDAGHMTQRHVMTNKLPGITTVEPTAECQRVRQNQVSWWLLAVVGRM